MEARPPDLYLLEDLDDASRKGRIADGDLAALRAVAGWVKRFVVRPHQDLGRDGPVCPFVPRALERKTLWLSAEHIAGRGVPDVVRLIKEYKTRLQQARPVHADAVDYRSIVVVFTDLSPDRAKGLFDDVLKQLAVPFYEEDGLVIGGFYEGNEGTAIYNRSFRPFASPAPFLLMRHAVVADWKFFLDDDDWLGRWARRYGESAAQALAEELRRLPWRAAGREGQSR